MKKITWKIKDSWVETKKDHPDTYTDYLFFKGWLKLSKLFPDVKPIYAIGGHFKGSHTYWHNFRKLNFGNVIQPFRQFFLRMDLGRWFITISRFDQDHYNSVDIVK